MKISYFKDTDTLYIELNQNASTYSNEVSDNVVLDMDDSGRIVGIEIEKASKNFDPSTFNSNELQIETF
jgi:uncharacterized protein YuzE